MSPTPYSRPSVQLRDATIFHRFVAGEEPKDIRREMGLTKSQYYDGLSRHRRRIATAEKIGKKRTAKKRESK